ncbi:hypothetical protein [endosymbiont GvMRE of Glomus versiforme]|uniref:hypothetical protein n=1 Tax=endosymbiont GvMRE of Glomus versiforme TaxID=2039283 RepID=UPI0011C39875|nr:hypothetical protein [endosymbiont GvMRE of Glomus versiforme]
MIGGIVWKYTQSDNNGQLSEEEELEKYLLEKRLELKKYFVFNLKELVKGNFIFKSGEKTKVSEMTRGLTSLLSRDLTKLTGKQKKFIYFFVLFVDSPGLSNGSELDQKIMAGNHYIVFDKTKINSKQKESWFRDFVWLYREGFKTFSDGIFFEPFKRPWVQIFDSKEKVLDFLRKYDFLL